jgi:hypothetical protein
MATSERRKYPRVPICDPISYISVDSEFALFSFVDLEKKLVEIKGRVVYCKQKQSGKFESGVSLQGTSAENIQFIKKLVRSYHYTKKDPRKFSYCSDRD